MNRTAEKAANANTMSKTPASLLERLRDPRADEAWATFIDLYTPLLYHWAYRAGLHNDPSLRPSVSPRWCPKVAVQPFATLPATSAPPSLQYTDRPPLRAEEPLPCPPTASANT